MPAAPNRRPVDTLAAQFAVQRPRLFAIAHRTLGSPWSADDAVQETWLRLQRADLARIENLQAWLTTVVSRVCIDLIRQQVAWREDLAADPSAAELSGDGPPGGGLPGADRAPDGPEAHAMRTEELGLAMQVVLDTLGPLERLALVLHDVFGLGFDDIAPIVERTPTTARQLASRARARLRGVDVTAVREHQRTAVDAFLTAARNGDFGHLLQLLDPEVELRADAGAVTLAAAGAEHGAPLLERRTRGADAVARVFAGRAELVEHALVNGVPAAVYAPAGTVHAAYLVHLRAGRITALDVIADPQHLAGFAIDNPSGTGGSAAAGDRTGQ